ncbi:MAG: IS3 family transposase [Brooklawnia sp.]
MSRAGYYAWAKRGDTPGPAATRRAEVTAAVIESHAASNGVNGHRRVLADLTADGVPASAGMVRSIMRQAGIAGIQPRTKKRTTIPADDAEQRPDLVKRDFTSDTPGTKLVGDITYLRTGEGWLFLATVIDLHSRMVVGWAMAEHMRTELISAALRMAHTHGHLAPGAIFHSDRGSQGGFNWSSQHLDCGGVRRWRRRIGTRRRAMCPRELVGSGERIARCVPRCVRPDALSPRARSSASSGD